MLASCLVVQKLMRVFVVTNTYPLVTGEGTVSREVTSQFDLLLGKMIDEILHARLFDRGNHRRNTALITLLNDTSNKRVGIAVSVIWDNESATTY